MVEYLKMVGTLIAGFQKAKVLQISRGKNNHVDSLPTLASSMDNCVPQIILVEALEKLSKECQLNVSVVFVTGPSWMDSIITFLFDGILPSKVKEVEKSQRISTWTIPIMFSSRKGGQFLSRVARRDLWEPYQGKITGTPSNDARVLVVENAKGCC